MSRRLAATVAAAAAALLFAATPGRAQRDFSKVEIETQEVAPSLYMLKGAGGNLGLSVGEDGVLLVDDQYAPLTDKIRAAIARITPKPVRFVLNTHHHGDHVGGNENFGKAGAVLVAHDRVRARLVDLMHDPAPDRGAPPGPAALPVITFDESLTVHLNGETIAVFHVPAAHTDGDAIVHFRNADVVHLGDCFFNGIYPFVDLDSGGSLDGVIAALDRVLPALGERTKIIPGHGPLADRAALVAYRDMLVASRDRLKPLVAAGRSLDDLKQEAPLADLDATWGGGSVKPERWLETVYRSLGGRVPPAAGR